MLKYYRRVVDHYRLPIRDYEEVLSVQGQLGQFEIVSRDRAGLQCTYSCRRVIVATGYYDNPNRLGVPGEDLAKVAHYYSEPHPYFAKKVAVIGGKNSAVEAALDLYPQWRRSHSHSPRRVAQERHQVIGSCPDILNRIERRRSRLCCRVKWRRFTSERFWYVRRPAREVLENDFVLALIGYHPDIDFLRSMGIEVDSKTMVPTHDPQTFGKQRAWYLRRRSPDFGPYDQQDLHRERPFPRGTNLQTLARSKSADHFRLCMSGALVFSVEITSLARTWLTGQDVKV